MTITEQLDKLGEHGSLLRSTIGERLDGYLRDVQVYEQIGYDFEAEARVHAAAVELLKKYTARIDRIAERYPLCGQDGDALVDLILVAREKMTVEYWDKRNKNGGGE